MQRWRRVRDEVSEACLAHAVEGKVKAAYLRADFLGERRELMRAWERHVCEISVDDVGCGDTARHVKNRTIFININRLKSSSSFT